MLRLSDQAEGLRLTRSEISSARPQAMPEPHRTPTIAVTSGKGGVGKTQLSANIAVLLAQQGKRVLLLDADLGLASLDLAFGIRPSADMLSVMRGQCAVEDILVETACGVHLLPACPGRFEMANLSSDEHERLMTLVRGLAALFDVWVMDTGAGIGSNSVGFAAAADQVVLVATPEPTSLRDAYAMAKVLHRRSGVERISLVANQVVNETEGLEVYERLQSVVSRFLSLELSYLGSVPRDEAVVRGVARGEPCVIGSPRSPASRALATLCRRLIAQAGPSRSDLLC
jgi:flagellar biosynthesis protein FlhG